jgi:hypothetical protein
VIIIDHSNIKNLTHERSQSNKTLKLNTILLTAFSIQIATI